MKGRVEKRRGPGCLFGGSLPACVTHLQLSKTIRFSTRAAATARRNSTDAESLTTRPKFTAGVARSMGHSTQAWASSYDVLRQRRQKTAAERAYASVTSFFASPAARVDAALRRPGAASAAESDEPSAGEEDEPRAPAAAAAAGYEEWEEEEEGLGLAAWGGQAAFSTPRRSTHRRDGEAAAQFQAAAAPRAPGGRLRHADGRPVQATMERRATLDAGQAPASARGAAGSGLALAQTGPPPAPHYSFLAAQQQRGDEDEDGRFPSSAQTAAEDELAAVLANGGRLPRGGRALVARAAAKPIGAPPQRTVLKPGGRFLTRTEAEAIVSVVALQRWIDANLVAPVDPLTGLDKRCKTKLIGPLRAVASGGATRGLGGGA